MQPPPYPAPRAQTTPCAETTIAVFQHPPPARQPKSSFEVADNPPSQNFKYSLYTSHQHRPAALSREAATRRRGAGARGREPSVSSFGSFLSDDRKELPRSRPQAAFSRRPQATKSPAAPTARPNKIRRQGRHPFSPASAGETATPRVKKESSQHDGA